MIRRGNVRNLRNLRNVTGFLTFLTSKSSKNARFLTFLTFLIKFSKLQPPHVGRCPHQAFPLNRQHDPTRPEDVLKVDSDDDGSGGDDAADALRYLVSTRLRVVHERKLIL